MKLGKRILAVILSLGILFVPTGALAMTPGEISAHYIKAIINKIAEDYRFNADKEAMYEAVLDYVMSVDPSLLEGSIKAVTDTLDEYSEYFTAEEMESFYDYVEQSYVGIGVTIQKRDDGILIIEVNPDGGAFDAGLQINDVIIEVEGENIVGLNSDKVSEMIRGEEGTAVNIKVRRGEQVIPFTVERRRISTETVGYTIEEGNIGYIYISQFASSTVDSMKTVLEQMRLREINKLVIDVRDNPGGELNSVLKILALFVPKNLVLTKVEYNDERFSAEIKSTAKFTTKPRRDIVILANENSASAAELFAGAMQYHKLAKVVGIRTFGKGSMQTFMGLNNPPGFNLGDIKLSVAEFTKPDGGRINGVGITPDVRVKNIYVPYDASGLTPMTISQRYTIGDEASDVLAVEERLDALGFYTGEVDGVFDEITAKATEQFQEKVGLFPYGVMDFTTQHALNTAIEEAEVLVDKQLETALEMLS